ncbi:MAG: hypothetical protein LBK60_11365 [Verrucomicrobiales bacterium]|jgi:hypothetical protein|nr:hypothetical protein [Verrucomicrobiales bacterium]
MNCLGTVLDLRRPICVRPNSPVAIEEAARRKAEAILIQCLPSLPPGQSGALFLGGGTTPELLELRHADFWEWTERYVVGHGVSCPQTLNKTDLTPFKLVFTYFADHMDVLDGSSILHSSPQREKFVLVCPRPVNEPIPLPVADPWGKGGYFFRPYFWRALFHPNTPCLTPIPPRHHPYWQLTTPLF